MNTKVYISQNGKRIEIPRPSSGRTTVIKFAGEGQVSVKTANREPKGDPVDIDSRRVDALLVTYSKLKAEAEAVLEMATNASVKSSS